MFFNNDSRGMKKLPDIFEQYEDIVILWALRVLLDLKGYTRMDMEFGLYGHERALSAVGLEKLIDKYDDDNALSKKEFRKILKRQSNKYEKKKIPLKGTLFDNIDQLGLLVGLNDTEKLLLAFGVLLHSVQDLEAICDVLSDVSSHSVVNILSQILGEKPVNVRLALSSDGLLNKTGLLRLQRDGHSSLEYQLSLLDEISDVLLDEHQPNIMESLQRFFMPGKKAKLKPDAFVHISKDYDLISSYLKATTAKKQAGVNILIYGPPGTGKTEMVRTLAADLDFDLYEVTTTGGDEDALMYQARVDSYQLCQQVLKRKDNTVILFDEIEDVFIRDGSMERFGIRTSTDTKKGWFNQLLEENTIPALWVSNVISHIDEAIIRRFDYVMELKTPPRKTRIKILKLHTRDLDVSDGWLEKISLNEDLAPGLISRAVKVVSELPGGDQKQTELQMERIISNTLHAMGYDKNLSKGTVSPITYRPDVLNPDYDLVSLQEGLEKFGQGRFCLYGPPGTGKSEFARYVAESLDKPLITKRASDLLDPYVGITEKLLKAMFEQALDEEAVLLLDEADSFLQDRTRARQNWEVTQVNELLTQMEQFEGIFICSTNLMDNLDQASLRRFDLKIKFDYLKPTQAWELFQQVLMDYSGVLKNEDVLRKKVKGMRGITPGDFATVVRQNRYSGKTLDAESLLAGLEREVDFKEKGKFKNIGFVTE
jgi:SpoVK/Ycf46/Vps4 family AAA+-type ATPase